MINQKWLRVSKFIPIWGTIINCLIIFGQLLKKYIKGELVSTKKLFICIALSCLGFLGAMIVCTVLFKLILEITGLSINPDIVMIILFIVSGFVMNFLFVRYYEKYDFFT